MVRGRMAAKLTHSALSRPARDLLLLFAVRSLCGSSNLVLKKIGAHIAIPTMIVAWGTVSCLTGLVQNYHGLMAARLILGLCESGLFPGLVLYLSMFCMLPLKAIRVTAALSLPNFTDRRHELQTRISLFFSAASLSGAFSGLLAAAILNLDGKGGQAGWRCVSYLPCLRRNVVLTSNFIGGSSTLKASLPCYSASPCSSYSRGHRRTPAS